MGVAGEIGEHCFWPGERRLGVDKPVLLHKRCEVGGEGLAMTQVRDLTEERQPARRVGLAERSPEEPPKQAGQDPYWQQETRLAAHPARPVEGYPTARHNHMD